MNASGLGLLSHDKLTQALADLDGWDVAAEGKAIAAQFVFTDFKQAFAFMTQVSAEAERLNHHPDWYNRYNIVRVTLTTHDLGGVSDRDIVLARFMSAAAAQVTASRGS